MLKITWDVLARPDCERIVHRVAFRASQPWRNTDVLLDYEDMVSDIKMRLIQRGLEHDPAKGKFGPWFYTMARNTAHDIIRHLVGRDASRLLNSDCVDGQNKVPRATKRQDFWRSRMERHKRSSSPFQQIDDLDEVNRLRQILITEYPSQEPCLFHFAHGTHVKAREATKIYPHRRALLNQRETLEKRLRA